MTVNREIDHEILDRLRRYLALLLKNPSSRERFLETAFSGTPLETLIDMAGKPDDFASHVINESIKFGEIAPGKPAIARVAEWLYERVGADEQQIIESWNILVESDADRIQRFKRYLELASTALIEVAKDYLPHLTDSSLTEKALSLLALLGKTDISKQLMYRAGDSSVSEEIQQPAIRALSALKEYHLLQSLLDIPTISVDLRRLVITELGESNDIESFNRLLQFAQDSGGNPEIAAALLGSLVEIAHTQPGLQELVLDVVVQYLSVSQEDETSILEALEALQNLDDSTAKASKHIQSLKNHSNSEIREIAQAILSKYELKLESKTSIDSPAKESESFIHIESIQNYQIVK